MFRDLRKATGLTQSEFGKRLGGVPLRTIQNWEGGVCEPADWIKALIIYRVQHDEALKIKEHDQEAEDRTNVAETRRLRF